MTFERNQSNGTAVPERSPDPAYHPPRWTCLYVCMHNLLVIVIPYAAFFAEG